MTTNHRSTRRLPDCALNHPLEPKHKPRPDDLDPSKLAKNADPVAQAIIKFYFAMNWRRRTSAFTVGDEALERAFVDLVLWMFSNDRRRDAMLRDWIGITYIKDWPAELTSPDKLRPPLWEEYPLHKSLGEAIRRRLTKKDQAES